MNSRGKKLFCNTISSVIFQITTIICGFILPRLILSAFGSDVNGLVSSITQFLGMIAFLELGVGSVVQSSLYKPLANNNYDDINTIITSANRFFSKLGGILLVYVILLVVFYPEFIGKKYEFWYTATLIIAISISSFAQYFFGIVNRLLLTADQKGYIQYNAQTIAVIVNTITCFLLIRLGCSIQIVKLTTSLIFLVQPLLIHLYVRKYYQINNKVRYDKEPIAQKWNGIAQHVAAVVLDGTDIIVLTLLGTLQDVSIYSVYFLVVKGVKQLFRAATSGITPLVGELWARRKDDELRKTFSWVEWGIHTGATYIFGVTAVLIVPFVRVYTFGITDANYYQPVFALLIVMANFSYCLRLPYNIVILAAGHYKQTQNNYIIAMILNILLSVSLVKILGLVGVAIGTLIAMIYQTIWMAWYDSRFLIRWPLKCFCKQLSVDLASIILMALATHFFELEAISYFGWTLLAIKVALASLVVVLSINTICYKKKVITISKKILGYFFLHNST